MPNDDLIISLVPPDVVVTLGNLDAEDEIDVPDLDITVSVLADDMVVTATMIGSPGSDGHDGVDGEQGIQGIPGPVGEPDVQDLTLVFENRLV